MTINLASQSLRWQATHQPVLLLLVLLGVLGCGPDESKPKVSDAELEQRQDKTLDISGNYEERTDLSGVHLKIENETKPFDIRVVFDLNRALGDGERTRIKEDIRKKVVRITESELQSIVAELEKSLASAVLGEGRQHKERGGENIALDGEGKVSEIVVESGKTKFYESSLSGSVEQFLYQLSFTFSAYQTSSTLDFRVSRNSEREYLRRDGTKGMSLSIWRTVYNGDEATNGSPVADSVPIALEGFMKQ